MGIADESCQAALANQVTGLRLIPARLDPECQHGESDGRPGDSASALERVRDELQLASARQWHRLRMAHRALVTEQSVLVSAANGWEESREDLHVTIMHEPKVRVRAASAEGRRAKGAAELRLSSSAWEALRSVAVARAREHAKATAPSVRVGRDLWLREARAAAEAAGLDPSVCASPSGARHAADSLL